jgi:pimeloyl-ACP methyl ester carboxylesterase
MMGGIKAQYDCIKVLSESEFYDDLKVIDVPVLVMHGEDDQICPFATTGAKSVKLLKHGTLKSYPGLPHGMHCAEAPEIENNQKLALECAGFGSVGDRTLSAARMVRRSLCAR